MRNENLMEDYLSKLQKIVLKIENNSEDIDQFEEIVEDLLRNIVNSEIKVTPQLLEKTKIAIKMKSLKKLYARNSFIVNTSKALIHTWRERYRHHLGEVRSQVMNASTTSTTTTTTTTTKKKSPQKLNSNFNDKSKVLTNEEKRLLYCKKYNTYTITFGDQAENHVGMQKIGSLSSEGFTFEDLVHAKEWFENRGIICEMIALHAELLPVNERYEVEEAYVLIARNGVTACSGEEQDPEVFKQEVFREQVKLKPDKQANMYGRVVNKHARYNLCFGDFDQEPDIVNGKGTVVSFERIPALGAVRDILPAIAGPKADKLEAEGNYYYDLKQCGIGYHGDAERMKVIALRLGASMELCYAWFQRSKPISQRKIITLHHGDMYIMSEKATGQDWRKKVIPTLRHAAGCAKFTSLPDK